MHGRVFLTEGTVYSKLRGKKRGDEPETIDQGSYHNTPYLPPEDNQGACKKF